MILKVTKITILNTQIIVNDLEDFAEFKTDLSQQLGVLPTDIHCIYSEVDDDIITNN